jgi:hypothetical protein
MGAKTALLAFSDGDIRPALLGATRSERTDVEGLFRQIHPGYLVASAGDGTLSDDLYPPDDITDATVLAGAELFCDRSAPGRLGARQDRVPGCGRRRRWPASWLSCLNLGEAGTRGPRDAYLACCLGRVGNRQRWACAKR